MDISQDSAVGEASDDAEELCVNMADDRPPQEDEARGIDTMIKPDKQTVKNDYTSYS